MCLCNIGRHKTMWDSFDYVILNSYSYHNDNAEENCLNLFIKISIIRFI